MALSDRPRVVRGFPRGVELLAAVGLALMCAFVEQHTAADLAASLRGAFERAFKTIDKGKTGERRQSRLDQGVQQFCSNWFNHDDATLVLFRKNALVTNIQFAEFASLVTLHVRHPFSEQVAWQFQTARQLKDNLKEMLSIDWPDKSPKQRAEHLAELYFEFFCRLLLLDDFRGSAILTTPKHVEVDREEICRQSGYVHSIGRLLVCSDIQAATVSSLTTAIRASLGDSDQRRTLCVLSHEGHDASDRQYRNALRYGIDDLKLHADKIKIEGQSLRGILSGWSEKFGDRFEISHSNCGLDLDFEAGDRAIWMLSDCDHNFLPQQRSVNARRYVLLFEQEFRNRNPLLNFNEAKPGWVLPHTIPHDLAAAMINLTRPWTEETRFLDPFGGVATSALEASKFDAGQYLSSDIDQLSLQAAEDNIHFFGLDDAEQIAVLEYIKTETSQDGAALSPLQLMSNLRLPGTLLPFASFQDLNKTGSREAAKALSRETFERRLLIYLLRRAQAPWALMTDPEKQDTQAATQSFEAILGEFETAVRDSWRVVDDLAPGDFSIAVKPHFDGMTDIICERADATLLQEDSVDVIVCDPPYGLNVKHEMAELGRLYAKFVQAAVGAVRRGGHLVICVPDDTFVAGRLPAFARPKFIVKQVLAEADARSKTILPYQHGGGHRSHYRKHLAPFYWVANKSLRRQILHFRFAP